MAKKFSVPLYVQTIFAMILGTAVGLAFGNQFAGLGILSKIIIQLIVLFATPLVFFAILDAILNSQFKERGVRAMFGISVFDSILAILLGLVVMNVFVPGAHLDLKSIVPLTQDTMKTEWNWSSVVQALIPDGIVSPFVKNQLTGVILVAVFIGLALKKTAKEGEAFDVLRGIVSLMLHSFFKILEWVLYLVPIAVFVSVAKIVGAHGFSLFKGLAVYLVTCLAGMALHILIVYQGWIKIVAGIPLKRFWKEAKEPAIYAFGVNSSLATLPVTLARLKRLGVSDASARLSACVGTNFNNDGILLYEVLAALFLAQANGIHVGFWDQIAIAVMCVLATLGVAGIPEAGIIALTLVIGVMGLPAECLPILLTVDWVLARCRSVTNVLGDMTVAVAIDAVSGRHSTRA